VTSTMPLAVAVTGCAPLEEPPFDIEIAVTAPATKVPTNASATSTGTHLDGFLGAG